MSIYSKMFKKGYLYSQLIATCLVVIFLSEQKRLIEEHLPKMMFLYQEIRNRCKELEEPVN